MPTVLNAANEVAVAAFLQDKIRFLEIAERVESTMAAWRNHSDPSLEELIAVDSEIRGKVV